MKKIVLILLVIVLVLTANITSFAGNDKSLSITVSNNLPFPVYKVITFSKEFARPIPNGTNFALFYKGKEVPIDAVVTGNRVTVRTVLQLPPSGSKILILKYGPNLKTDYKKIFLPNFAGTEFVGIGSGKLFVTSLKDNNKTEVTLNNGKVLFQGVLSKKEVKIIPLENRDEIFSIRSEYPIFAEVSSLKPNCLKNSSDDVSSVLGTYFVLYIPREVVISAYQSTHIVIKMLSGKSIANVTLPAKGQYKNLNLTPGFYEISANNPVTIQFGCEDDNIYAINYGSLNAFKGVSFGNVVCSALYSDTKIRIKTEKKAFPEVVLQNRGDYIYKDVITTFEDNKSELSPVYITYNKPILIYSDSNHGNIGGEQIPSIYNKGRVYSFLTGKIFNFSGLKHKRKVVIIPTQDNTSVIINGKKFVLPKALDPKTLLFDKSYSKVNIISDKPVSVFEIGMTTSLEFLSMLLPVTDNSCKVSIAVPGTLPGGGNSGNESNGGRVPGESQNLLSKYFAPIGGFFSMLFANVSKNPHAKNVIDSLNEFGASLAPYFKELSKQIIALFMPVSEMVYPYVHTYLPNLSKGQIAAIIFYILLTFIIILLIPKRKKRNVSVVKVKEEKEIKKKSQVAFNVKTIEEKDVGQGVKFGAPGKPKTLAPVKKPEAHKQEKSGGKLHTEAPTVPPFRRATIKPGKALQTEKPKELGNKISSLYKKPKQTIQNLPIEKPTKEKAAQIDEEKVKKETLSEKEILQRIREKAKKESLISKEKLLEEKSAEQSVEQKAVQGETIESVSVDGDKKVIKSEEKEKTSKQEKSVSKEEAVAKARKKSIFSYLFGRKQKPVRKEPEKAEEIVEKTRSDTVNEEVSQQTGSIGELMKTERAQKEISVNKEEGKITIQPETDKKSSAFSKLFGKKTAKPEEKETEEQEKEKTQGKESKNLSFKGTSLDELLARVKEVKTKEELKKKQKEGGFADSNKAAVPEKEETKEVEKKLKATGLKIDSSVVLDSDSVDLLSKNNIINRINRIFVSAREQSKIDRELKEKYRFGVIALTPIELRIAEDLARRISSKKSTGEILLIARKVGVKQIIVNDNPKIKDYQGIKIINVNDIIKGK